MPIDEKRRALLDQVVQSELEKNTVEDPEPKARFQKRMAMDRIVQQEMAKAGNAPAINPYVALGKGRSELEPRTKKFGVGVKKQLAKAEAIASRVGAAVPEPVHKGFWWAIDKLDRPRNALQVATRGAIANGDMRDVPKDFWSGIKATERADFLDILDEIETDSEFYQANAPKWLKAGTTPQEIEDPDLGRLAVGFLGDMIYDPLNIIPFAKATRVDKLVDFGKLATKVGAPTLGKLANVTRESQVGQLMQEVNRKTLNLGRTSGNPIFDRAFDARIDTKYATESGFIKYGLKVSRMYEKVPSQHVDLIPKLMEEADDLDPIIRLADQFRTGQSDVNQAMAISNFRRGIKNPKAFVRLTQLGDEDFQAIAEAAKETRKFDQKRIQLEEASGKVTHKLGNQLFVKQTKIQRSIRAATLKANRRATRVAKMQNTADTKSIRQQKQLLAKVMGPKKLAQIFQQMNTPLGNAPATQAQYMTQLNKAMRQLPTGFLPGLRQINKNEAALPTFFDHFRNELMKSMQEEKVAKLFAEHDEVVDLIQRTPAYVHHVLSADAAWAIARRGSGGGGSTTMKSAIGPDTAADMVRAFQEKGRPLSLEEVEDLIQNRPTEVGGEIRVALRGQPLTRKPKWREIAINKNPQEFADFFEVKDPRKILEIATKETAEAVSRTTFFQDITRHFGRIDEAEEIALRRNTPRAWRPTLDPNVPKDWVTLDQVGHSELIQSMPELKGVKFDPDLVPEIIRVEKRFAHAAGENPVLKAMQLMHDYWISYNLPLLPDFNSRNYMGQIANMVDGGWNPLNPKHFRNLPKATLLQGFSNTGNIQKMRNLRFLLKDAGVQMTGDKFIGLALRRGIINDGFWTRETGDAFRLYDAPAYKSLKNYNPVNPKNLKIDRNPYVAMGRKVGQFNESHTRLAYFASLLEDGKSIDDAALMTKKFMGNFHSETMTEFEQGVKKFVPFYRWMRFNVPMQWETTLQSDPKRRRLLALLRGQELGQEAIERGTGGAEVGEARAEDLPPDVPEWIERAAGLPIRRDPRTGELQVLLLENFLPIADLDNFMFPMGGVESARETGKFLLQNLTPIGQSVQTFSTQRNPYFDQDLRDTQMMEMFGVQTRTELRFILSQLRLLSELDRVDPLSAFHRVRKQKPAYTRIADALGFSVQQVNQAQGEINDDKDRLERLNREISRLRKLRKEGVPEGALDQIKAMAKGGKNGDSSSTRN